MKSFKLVMSYDGSEYSGFQRQSDESLRTVQGVIEETFESLFGESVTIHGAGRTDAGVHARAQVAHFSTNREIPAERLQYAMNRALPASLVLTEVEEVNQDFHSRKCALGKWYSYRIYNGQTPPAMGHGYFTHVPIPMDRELFEAALEKIVGYHNFQGFCGRGATVLTFDRTVYLMKVCVENNWWQIHFVGDGFLRKMVRNLVGTAIDVALGRRPLTCVDEALATGERTKAGPTAAADGLTMEQVFYNEAELQACIKKLEVTASNRVGSLFGEY